MSSLMVLYQRLSFETSFTIRGSPVFATWPAIPWPILSSCFFISCFLGPVVTSNLRVCPSSSTRSRELALACIILAAVLTISSGNCLESWTEETHADISFRYCKGIFEYIHKIYSFQEE